MNDTILHPAVVALPIAPAPWRVNSFESVCDANGFEHLDSSIAINHEIQDMSRHWGEQPDCYRDITEEENKANNTLVAIAPEMLSWMVERVVSGDIAPADREKACDIIRRASNGKINL